MVAVYFSAIPYSADILTNDTSVVIVSQWREISLLAAENCITSAG